MCKRKNRLPKLFTAKATQPKIRRLLAELLGVNLAMKCSQVMQRGLKRVKNHELWNIWYRIAGKP